MTTPAICPHCGRLMTITTISVQPSGMWDETWRCPDGRWMHTRTVPPPPGYERPTDRRQLAIPHNGPEPPDDYIDIHELARMIHRSLSWIRHQPPDAIPGRRQHCEGGRVEWNRHRVQDWIDSYTLPGTR